eukprot:scaffold7823_cov239-Pinguiococcus_pyrenoidosus.AAC.1
MTLKREAHAWSSGARSKKRMRHRRGLLVGSPFTNAAAVSALSAKYHTTCMVSPSSWDLIFGAYSGTCALRTMNLGTNGCGLSTSQSGKVT